MYISIYYISITRHQAPARGGTSSAFGKPFTRKASFVLEFSEKWGEWLRMIGNSWGKYGKIIRKYGKIIGNSWENINCWSKSTA